MSESEPIQDWPPSPDHKPPAPLSGSPSSSIDSPSSVPSPPTPLPHTPLFSPQHFENEKKEDESHELPLALLQSGWRKCWSKRENKWYFFNKLTQQAIWDMPEIGRKRSRTISSEEQMPAPKRFVPSSDWDLTVVSNARMAERVPLSFYPPHPDIEAKRLETVIKMRNLFAEMCHNKGGFEVPQDSLNRWFLERTLENTGKDPVFASGCINENSPGMLRDLSSSVPIRMQKLTTIADARRQLSRYAEGARRLAESCRHMTAEQRKQIKWQCQEMFDWLRGPQQNASFDEHVNRLKFLRTQCQVILEEGQKDELEHICSRLNCLSQEFAHKLEQQHNQMLINCGIDTQEYPLPPPRPDKVVTCYSAQLRFPSPRLPTVTMEQTKDDLWVRLRYREEHTKLNSAHFFKLEQLYKYNCFDDKRYDLFLARVWTLLKRYQCLYGPGTTEGYIVHQSLPVSVLHSMHEDFGATFECFANPFNCYFRQFCSVFPDTDGYFGSRGSFLDFYPLEGSFILKPIPFCQQMTITYIRHALSLLASAADRPMSFVVFLIDWRPPNYRTSNKDADWSESDDQSEAVELIRTSCFNKYKQVIMPSYDHWYRNGAQQWINKEDLYIRSSFGTMVFWLQTESAAKKWPVHEQKVAKLIEAFKFPNSTDT